MSPQKLATAPTVTAHPSAAVVITRSGAHVTSLAASLAEGTHFLYSAATVAQLEAEIQRLRGAK